MVKFMPLLLVGAIFYTCTGALNASAPGPSGLCGYQNEGAVCLPVAGRNGTLVPSCCSTNGFCGTSDIHCLVSNGCQQNCREEPKPEPIPIPPARLSAAARNGIIGGIIGLAILILGIVLWIAPLKAIQAFHRPFDLYDLYGLPGLVLFFFGSRTTWRTEAYVLGKVNDKDAFSFKKSVQDECTMISVAAAIVAQISITALSLNDLSQTHWIARAFFVFSVISSLMAVYYATTQQRTMGRLLQPTQVRGWIRGQLPPQRLDSIFKSQRASRPRSDPEYFRPLEVQPVPSNSANNTTNNNNSTDDLTKSCFTPSVASVVTMSAPQFLLSSSLFTLILGIGVYFGFTWTRNIDFYAQKGDSRNVMVLFLFSVVVCFMVYSLSGLIQDEDTSTEKMILRGYVDDYVGRDPEVVTGRAAVGGISGGKVAAGASLGFVDG